jgi:subtilisin family serine protease
MSKSICGGISCSFSKLIRISATCLVIACLLSGNMVLPASAGGTSTYDPDILLAAVAPNSDMQKVKTMLDELHATIVRSYTLPYITLLRIKTASGKFVETAQKLTKEPGFLGVQPNWHCRWAGRASSTTGTTIGTTTGTSGNSGGNTSNALIASDPLFAGQWNLLSTKVPQAWGLAAKPTSHWIAILDSGCAEVPDLSAKMAAGMSLIGSSSYAQDDGGTAGHGTAMAGIAAALTDNKVHIAGADPWAYLYPIKIGNADGTDDEHIILGIAATIGQGIPMLMIGAAPVDAGWTLLSHPLVYGMLALYHTVGGIAFAPAGNDGTQLAGRVDPSLILVAATDKNGKLAHFSNYGGPVWLSAPGVDVSAVDNQGNAVAFSGTSSACALVAGTASLIWNSNPRLSNHAVIEALARTTSSPAAGYGIVNAQAALQLAKSSTVAPPTSRR